MPRRERWIWVVVVLCACVAPVRAQVEEPSASSPTVAWLEAQAARVEADESLGEQARASVAGAYREAAELLEAAEEHSARAREFDRLGDGAARQLASIRAELAAPPGQAVPEVPPDASLDQLEQALAQANADLEVARQRGAEVRREIADRQSRLEAIPREIAEVNQRLETLAEEIEGFGAPEELDEAGRARLARLVSERTAAARRLEALQAERDSYEARSELVTARREREDRRVARAEALASAWQRIVAARRTSEAEAAARRAERLAREAELRRFEALDAYAQENRRIAEARTGEDGVTERILWARQELARAQARRVQVERSYLEVQQLVADLGITRATALALRRELSGLPGEQALRRTLSEASSKLEETELARMRAAQLLGEMRDTDAAVAALLSRVRVTGDDRREASRSIARDLVTARRELLTQHIADLNSSREALLSLVRALDPDDGLIRLVDAFRSYIRERIFWARSVSGPNTPNPRDALDAIAWLFDREGWSAGLRLSITRTGRTAGMVALAILSVGVLLALRMLAKSEIRRRAELVARYRTDSFSHSAIVLLLTVPLAALWPWLIWLASEFLLLPGARQTEAVHAFGEGLRDGALLLVPLEAVRQLVRSGGLAEAHFQWPAASLRPLRRRLGVASVPLVALVTIAGAMVVQPNEAFDESLGRVAFMLVQLVLAGLIGVLFYPEGPVLKQYLDRDPGGMIHRLRFVLYAGVVATPLTLAILSGAGYHRAAIQLYMRLGDTAAFLVVLAVANGMLMRWLFIAHRKLAIGEAKRRLAHAEGEEEGARAASVDEADIDVPAISAKTKLLFRNVVAIVLIFGLAAIWTQALPALRGLDRVQVWPSFAVLDDSDAGAAPEVVSRPPAEGGAPVDGGAAPATPMPSPVAALPAPDTDRAGEGAPAAAFTLTVADLASATIIIVVTVIIFRHLPALVEIVLLQRLPLDAGSRYAVSTILRYVIGIIGVAIAFGALGLSWSKVQWLAAALTFGLAFGLQEIFANFISGIIMLLERPVRVGDTVTVEGVSGTVSRIRMRATTIQDWDRKEMVIPNKTFITGQIINWTLSDTILRLTIPVGVSYDSDVELVRDTLLRIATEHPGVLADPPARALFRGFGDSTLNFELRFFIPNLESLLDTSSEIHHAIAHAFREAGIEIAYPQRDLHLRSSDELERLRGLVKPMTRAEAAYEAQAPES